MPNIISKGKKYSLDNVQVHVYSIMAFWSNRENICTVMESWRLWDKADSGTIPLIHKKMENAFGHRTYPVPLEDTWWNSQCGRWAVSMSLEVSFLRGTCPGLQSYHRARSWEAVEVPGPSRSTDGPSNRLWTLPAIGWKEGQGLVDWTNLGHSTVSWGCIIKRHLKF